MSVFFFVYIKNNQLYSMKELIYMWVDDNNILPAWWNIIHSGHPVTDFEYKIYQNADLNKLSRCFATMGARPNSFLPVGMVKRRSLHRKVNTGGKLIVVIMNSATLIKNRIPRDKLILLLVPRRYNRVVLSLESWQAISAYPMIWKVFR